MRIYQKAAISGSILGVLGIVGGASTLFKAHKLALNEHPAVQQVLEKILHQEKNKEIIEMTINNSENVIACMSCYSEKNKESADVLSSRLSEFSEWNRAALNKVNSTIRSYRESPVMVVYENSKKDWMRYGYYTVFGGLGILIMSVLGVEAGDYLTRREKSKSKLSIESTT